MAYYFITATFVCIFCFYIQVMLHVAPLFKFKMLVQVLTLSTTVTKHKNMIINNNIK